MAQVILIGAKVLFVCAVGCACTLMVSATVKSIKNGSPEDDLKLATELASVAATAMGMPAGLPALSIVT